MPDRVPWKAQLLGLEFGECGGIPGLTAERWIEGEVREESVLGNACGGKPGSHGSKTILLSHM